MRQPGDSRRAIFQWCCHACGNAAVAGYTFMLTIGIAMFLSTFCSMKVQAKTNQPVYEEPFDVAGGGASLTWATQEGVLFANPALLPYGEKFFRWFGLKTMIMTGKDSVDFAQSAATGGGVGETTEIIDTAFETPVHFGVANALSFISNNGGLGVFYRIEPDIKASKYGAAGVPNVTVQAEGYGGAIASFAIRTPVRWWSLGVSGKYIVGTEPKTSIDINSQEALQNLSDAIDIDSLKSYGMGMGFDAGMLFFFQGDNMDFRIAGKVDDLGNTKLAGGTSPESLKQVVSGGLGLTFHTEADALHLSADYRDILGAYEEDLFRRMYMGMKVMLRTYVGFAAGYYQGYPSYGAEIDLIMVRIAGTYYTREMGEHAGVDPRGIYILTIGTGI